MPFRNLNDGVTPVVIGGNDWASAWATDDNGIPLVNPAPWSKARDHGIAPIRLDHALLYGPNVAEVQKIFTEVLGFYLVERVLTPDGTANAAIWL